MHLVLNGLNGEFLRDITLKSAEKAERVDAAVAYVSKEDLLFGWCWDNKIPLRFWGRFDDGVPVSPLILEKFLSRRSANYRCRLLRNFHAKVIWWHGVGAYLGSANLSDKAWYSNVEAGTFFEEGELVALGLDSQLQVFFQALETNSSPLTEEILKALQVRQKQLSLLKKADEDNAASAVNNLAVKPWSGLVTVPKKAANDRRKIDFLNEWNGTLTLLRNLSVKVADSSPIWVNPATPSGAHVDQFLHAHYYNRVMKSNRSYFEEWHDKHVSDPDAAEIAALSWWKERLTPPSNEDRMLNEWAPYLRAELSIEKLGTQKEEGLFEIFRRVHAVADHARRVANQHVRLEGGKAYTMDEKTRAFSKMILASRSQSGKNIFEMLNHVFYGGDQAEVPLRLWDAIENPTWKIEHLGRSALGELVGWALPDAFPPRNARTSKALRSLGHLVSI